VSTGESGRRGHGLRLLQRQARPVRGLQSGLDPDLEQGGNTTIMGPVAGAAVENNRVCML
jgi:hypothetical protein